MYHPVHYGNLKNEKKKKNKKTKRKERKGPERISEEIMGEYSINMMKDLNLHIQLAQKIPNRITQRQHTKTI